MKINNIKFTADDIKLVIFLVLFVKYGLDASKGLESEADCLNLAKLFA